jgi:hypothetical protein
MLNEQGRKGHLHVALVLDRFILLIPHLSREMAWMINCLYLALGGWPYGFYQSLKLGGCQES